MVEPNPGFYSPSSIISESDSINIDVPNDSVDNLSNESFERLLDEMEGANEEGGMFEAPSGSLLQVLSKLKGKVARLEKENRGLKSDINELNIDHDRVEGGLMDEVERVRKDGERKVAEKEEEIESLNKRLTLTLEDMEDLYLTPNEYEEIRLISTRRRTLREAVSLSLYEKLQEERLNIFLIYFVFLCFV